MLRDHESSGRDVAMTEKSFIRIERHGAVGHRVMDRPGRLN
jgi:hypothetical protein